MVTEQEIRALERYRLNASLVQWAFHHYWNDNPDPERQGRGDPNDPAFFGWMSLWYSTLWVAWEGCTDRGLQLAVDGDTQMKTLLRKFRNATFHPQQSFPDHRIRAYIDHEDSVQFAYALSHSLALAIRQEAEALGMTPNEGGFYLDS